MKQYIHYRWVQVAIILLATTIAYANIFGNGFVIDDQYFIKEWQLTRSWGSVGQLLAGANPESQPGVYRPIRSLLYLVYYQFFGTNPFFYHLHSLLVHLAATVLVYLIVLGISTRINSKSEIRNPKQYQNSNDQNSKQFRIWDFYHLEFVSNFDIRVSNLPFMAALLFGLHPVHTESITYIAASMEMTGVVFFFAAFLAYLKEKRILAVILAIFAFFTYEMTITLPLLLLLYEWTLGKKDWRKTLPYWVAAVGFFAVRFAVGVGLSRGEYLAYSFFHTQLTMAKMWVKYLLLLIWPATLSHNHTVVPGFEAFMTPYSDQAAILSQTILDPEILASITVIIVIIFIIVISRKKHPMVSFCVGWFFISLLPVAYFFPQGTAIAEKYLYIASFGFVLALAWAFYNVYNSYNRYKNYIFLMILMVGLFYGARTAIRNANWFSPRTLWEYEARIHPASELAFYNLGIIYGEGGEREKAVAAYTKALDLKPQFWEAEHNLKNLQKL